MIPNESDPKNLPSEAKVDLYATDAPSESSLDFRPLDRLLGGYQLIRELGHGGMGVVYEAVPCGGGEPVALKTLQHGSSATVLQLKSEFRVLCDLSHPNLVRLGKLDTSDRMPFFTMELLSGRPFDEYVRSTFESAAAVPSIPFNESRLRDALSQLVKGLFALHEKGLIHRDVKPSNVMVTDQGRVVILDMGLAVEVEGSQTSDSQIERAGTPYFMAPEQARNGRMTPASDWYAVGVMLFEALTGERAFQSRRFDALLKEKLERCGPSPRDILSSVPEDLDDLCNALLRPSPNDRPQDEEIALRIHGIAKSTMKSSKAPTSWIGREKELQIIRQSWQRVRKGEPVVLMISGPSGLGKSSLVDHFLSLLRQEQSVVVLRGRCYENEAVAYRGFDSVIDALAMYLRRLPKAEVERIVPLHIELLCQLFPVIGEVPVIAKFCTRFNSFFGDAREQRQKGIAALRELVSRLARFVPVVMFIDDLHQGDEDTAAIFCELFRRDDAPPMMFIGTYRSDDVGGNDCLRRIIYSKLAPTEQSPLLVQVELSIEKFTRDESVQLAISLLTRHHITSKDDAQAIADETHGDPLFIAMLAEHRGRLQTRETLRRKEGFDQQDSIGLTLSAVIQDRVRALPKHERVALEILTAAGRPVDEHDLELAVAGHGSSIDLIRSLRIGRLVRRLGDRERIEPFHDKVRETIASMISARRMSKHCITLAEIIDRDAADRDVEFLADLYRRGGNRLRAGECYEAAAAIADSVFAFPRAIECYRYAIELLETKGNHELRLRRGLGDALANASRSAEAARQYLVAASLAPADEQVTLQQLASLRFLTSGHVDEGIQSLRKILIHHRLPWPASRAGAIAGLLYRTAILRVRGLKMANRVSASQTELNKLETCWAAAAGLSLVDPLRGSFYIAESLRRSLRLGSPTSVPRDLAAYMGQAAIGGSRSRRQTRRVLIACRKTTSNRKMPYGNAIQLIARGIAALLRGQWASSLRCCDRAIGYFADESCRGKTWELNTARTFGLWALQYQGNLIELARRQPELLRAAKESDDLFATLNFGTQVMAHLQLAADQPHESLRRLEEDKGRLSNRGFFIQHHNYVLAKTYTQLYLNRPDDALATITGQWKNYRREFLSRIQQVRIDHHQVATRAHLAAAEAGIDRQKNLSKAYQFVALLRSEKVHWASALADAFESSCLSIQGREQDAIRLLAQSKKELKLVGMSLFSNAAKHHLARFLKTSGGEIVDGYIDDEDIPPWNQLGVANGLSMARTFIPGFCGPP